MQIHYRLHGDDNVAQLKRFIFIVLLDLDRKEALRDHIFFSFYFEHQTFCIESSSLSLEGIPTCPSLFLIVKGQSSDERGNLLPVHGPG